MVFLKLLGIQDFKSSLKTYLSVVEGIKNALNDNSNLGVLARKRIIAKFPLDKRKKELVRMIEETIR